MSETTEMTSAGEGVYEVPEELRDFRELVNRLAQEQIAPRAAEIDEEGEDLRSGLEKQVESCRLSSSGGRWLDRHPPRE